MKELVNTLTVLSQACALAHRSLFVLKHFIGLFEAAALLSTLPLNVPLSQLLQEAIGSRQTLQDGVSILTIEECCNTDMKQNPKFSPPY